MKKTNQELRQIAAGAVRSQCRKNNIDPQTIKPISALMILDDIARSDPDLVASRWYYAASDNQISLFLKDWRSKSWKKV